MEKKNSWQIQTTKAIQEEVDLNNTVSMKDIEFIVKNYMTQKTPNPNDFIGEFCQTFKEK